MEQSRRGATLVDMRDHSPGRRLPVITQRTEVDEQIEPLEVSIRHLVLADDPESFVDAVSVQHEASDTLNP